VTDHSVPGIGNFGFFFPKKIRFVGEVLREAIEKLDRPPHAFRNSRPMIARHRDDGNVQPGLSGAIGRGRTR
jgi:hypothetical protein